MNANVTEPCAPPLHTPVTIGRSRMPGVLRAGSKTEARREVAFDLLVDPATDPAGHCEPRRPTARCCARCRARAGAETEGRGERAGHESSQHAAVVQQTKPRKVPRARTGAAAARRCGFASSTAEVRDRRELDGLAAAAAARRPGQPAYAGRRPAVRFEEARQPRAAQGI